MNNLELWEQAEKFVQDFFGLKATSGSGRGHDKGDAKDKNFQVEVKQTSKPSFSVNFAKLKGYRLNAIKDRKLFFLCIIPSEGDKLIKEDSWTVLPLATFKSLLENQKDE